ncbi:uncharacterized protein LOC129760124 [Uranotaenia lowii]|uniref:uncharacterized protein LOC129760124 n=1 Tax=Uranotaenia lowii TaxID=190385 RepID=UPI00247AE5E3|nr:uncharacterized protein LOC129760124 [Uranotaenia lowii]XP_055613684.1 uncharacterized protein LOC129760124 [Uranotaenia lowii]
MIYEHYDSSEEEPDFCLPQTKNQQEPERDENSKGNHPVEWVFRRHTLQELYPKTPDSGSGKDFLPGAYWPVYVNGFKVESTDQADWYDQVANYFAHHGLLTRMVYFHLPEGRFSEHQLKYQVMDMLVYFVSQKDAQRAIQVCHRESYYGYKLNVLCGREPQLFDVSRSFVAKDFAADSGQRGCEFPTEFRLEYRLEMFGNVEYTNRVSLEEIAFQFESREAMINALEKVNQFTPAENKLPHMQRYLEKDVLESIKQRIQTDPSFMDSMPKPHILQYFLDGVQPEISTPWKNHRRPFVSKQVKRFPKEHGHGSFSNGNNRRQNNKRSLERVEGNNKFHRESALVNSFVSTFDDPKFNHQKRNRTPMFNRKKRKTDHRRF